MESFANTFMTSDLDYALLHRFLSTNDALHPSDLSVLVKFHQQSHLSHYPSSFRAPPRCGSALPEDSEDQDVQEKLQQAHEVVAEVILRGSDQGHVPAEYTVKGLRRHEMPVMGVCVDSRISPGFRYRVRRTGSSINNNDDLLWGGKVRTLQSVGMGYGRRLTFQDDQHNNNECYFWSDSEPAGYAFSIHAVEEGQKFLIQGEDDAVWGEGCVEAIEEPQEEVAMATSKGHVRKLVEVTLTCRLTYYQKRGHGLMELLSSEDYETVTGQAVVVRTRASGKASLQAVEDVFLPRLGRCKLVPDIC